MQPGSSETHVLYVAPLPPYISLSPYPFPSLLQNLALIFFPCSILCGKFLCWYFATQLTWWSWWQFDCQSSWLQGAVLWSCPSTSGFIVDDPGDELRWWPLYREPEHEFVGRIQLYTHYSTKSTVLIFPKSRDFLSSQPTLHFLLPKQPSSLVKSQKFDFSLSVVQYKSRKSW